MWRLFLTVLVVVCLELLVLASLRLLGSGCTFDLAEELTNVNSNTIRDFFQKKFCKWGRELSKKMVRLPVEEEEMRHVVGLYERIGLPGCVGSVDSVHLVWDKCPAGFLSQCKGKEKHATLAFQAVVLHTKRYLLSPSSSLDVRMINRSQDMMWRFGRFVIRVRSWQS